MTDKIKGIENEKKMSIKRIIGGMNSCMKENRVIS